MTLAELVAGWGALDQGTEEERVVGVVEGGERWTSTFCHDGDGLALVIPTKDRDAAIPTHDGQDRMLTEMAKGVSGVERPWGDRWRFKTVAAMATVEQRLAARAADVTRMRKFRDIVAGYVAALATAEGPGQVALWFGTRRPLAPTEGTWLATTVTVERGIDPRWLLSAWQSVWNGPGSSATEALRPFVDRIEGTFTEMHGRLAADQASALRFIKEWPVVDELKDIGIRHEVTARDLGR